MKKTLLFSTFICSFIYAQNYAVDQIPADLVKDAYAVVRQNDEKISWILALFTRKNQKSAHFSPICFFPTDRKYDRLDM